MLKNIIHFIKYHNFFTLAVVVVMVGGSSAFAASPELRETAGDVLVGKTEVVVSIDNTALLSADFDNFNPELVITAVSEDADAYYISYTFNTFAVLGGAWGAAFKEGEFVVSKKSLGDTNLRAYVEEELKEIARAEIAFLKEVQEAEREKGETNTMVAVVYTGLLGLVVDPKEKEVEIKPVDALALEPTPATEPTTDNQQPTTEASIEGSQSSTPETKSEVAPPTGSVGTSTPPISELEPELSATSTPSILDSTATTTPETSTNTSETNLDLGGSNGGEVSTTPETTTKTDLEAEFTSENETATSTPATEDPTSEPTTETQTDMATEEALAE